MLRRTIAKRFFGKGWDNAALDTVYRGLLKKPEVNAYLTSKYVGVMTPEDVSAIQAKVAAGGTFKIFLAPDLGDPHRLLKAYSLTAYPILNERGDVLTCDVGGKEMEAYADPDDDYSKVCIPDIDAVVYLSQQLLTAMDWEASPRGAASLLESLYRGAEVPDHVFATPAVIEREF